jgi:hypoxanthine phosphoribosyltransferase
MSVLLNEVRQVEQDAELLYSDAQVSAALDRMADEMNSRLADSDPVVLCAMNGGVVTMGHLLTRLRMPLTIDYIHATRYRNTTEGQVLEWVRSPCVPLSERDVIIVDDILDEGVTLAAIVKACHDHGARNVYTCVLVNKLDVPKAEVKVDFLGMDVPNKYVFGYGMDYKGYLRNAAGIYAVREEQA